MASPKEIFSVAIDEEGDIHIRSNMDSSRIHEQLRLKILESVTEKYLKLGTPLLSVVLSDKSNIGFIAFNQEDLDDSERLKVHRAIASINYDIIESILDSMLKQRTIIH